MLESKIEAKFNLGVRKAGGIPIKLAPSKSGLPDRLVVFPDRIEFVELKKDDGETSPIQKHMHRKLRSLGATVFVLTGITEVEAWLEEIKCARVE
jgi:hypothetical protein